MRFFSTLLFVLINSSGFAQVFSFNSSDGVVKNHHRILMDNEFIIETVFNADDGNFILTRGGYYNKSKSDDLDIIFEFNSNYKIDSLKKLTFSGLDKLKKESSLDQDLDGKWLMAGRVGPDAKEKRRDLTRSRKTLKFLIDGYFQWTAYNTETYQFFGSGGGSYSTSKGEYNESIDYFSRDKTRVGINLSFTYEKKADDWYHSGFSSKGSPLNEIWTLRKRK